VSNDITAKTLYDAPAILRLQTGQSNKYGAAPSWTRIPRTHIDGVSVEDLTERFGSPLFVFSEKALRERIGDVRQAFSTRYPKMEFAWSYKTNYLDAICAITHQEGFLAEVVSRMEYEKARRLGVPGDRIIFNGPHKSRQILERAVTEGARIHIDHFDEIDDLEQLAADLDVRIPVALRLNLDAGVQPQWTRFGFNLESGQALDAARRIRATGRLHVVGLHCHIGTFILDPTAYRTLAEKLVGFGYRLEDELGYVMDYLDFGGGLPSNSRLKGTLLPPEVSVPSLDRYAEEMAAGLRNSLRPGHYPRIILESGRALVDEAGSLITTNLAAKRLQDGRKSYVLDAGVNLLYTSTWYKYKVEVDREVRGAAEPSILNGPLCMNIDVVDESCMLPPLPRGSRLVLSPVGAYNVTQSMQFIEYRPASVLITSSGEPVIIREREDLTDLVGRERLPAHLTGAGAPKSLLPVHSVGDARRCATVGGR